MTERSNTSPVLIITLLILAIATAFFAYKYFTNDKIIKEKQAIIDENQDIINEKEKCKIFVALLKESEKKTEEAKKFRDAQKLAKPEPCLVTRGFAINYKNTIHLPVNADTDPAAFSVPNYELARLITAHGGSTSSNPLGETIVVLGRRTDDSKTCVIMFPRDGLNERRMQAYSIYETHETFPALQKTVAQMDYFMLFNCK